ncbi:hypothetical protein OG786_29175 [Streptomyces sp. NBC_00101]|uniref:hypothetical protein n=1 Tax=Streptomyces sp. NBC_00101 TaxID=2975651 RepID=UPI00324F37F0
MTERPARIPLDNLTSDQLDALYARAESAVAAVAQVRSLCDRYQAWHEGGWAPANAGNVAAEFRAALDGDTTP